MTSPATGPRIAAPSPASSRRWAVEVEDLSVTAPMGNLLTDVTLRLPEAGCLGVVGETGSGKSLACRTALGLLPVGLHTTAGRVNLAGQDMTHASVKQWRRLRGTTVAMVPQASMSSLDPLRTVGFQLKETIRAVDPQTRERERRAIELLEQMQIRALRDVVRRYPHELSGGMRQRVMIALALAGRPSILVADEPTTTLDATVQKHILDILCGLKANGMSILVVSHDLGVIRHLADDFAVMYAGTTIETGSRDALLARPWHPYTQALINARPTPEQRKKPLLGLLEMPPGLPAEDPGCRFAPRCPLVADGCLPVQPPLIELVEKGQRRTIACVHVKGSSV